MMRLLRYFLIERRVKNPLVAARIYQMIYHPEIASYNSTKSSSPEVRGFEDSSPSQPKKVHPPKVTDKDYWMPEDEVKDGLEYLKSKELKTTKDRQNIQVLEAVLKNKQRV